MKELLGTSTENLVATGVLFLFLFAVIVALFAGKNTLAMLLGLLRVVISFFYSPFVYMRKAVLELAEYGTKGEAEFARTRQYLINKLMLALQTALVVLSVAVLAVGLVSAWNALLPPKPLRERISALEEKVKSQKSDLAQMQPGVRQMETAWANERDLLIKAYNEERTKKATAASAENVKLADSIATKDATTKRAFDRMKNYYSQYEPKASSLRPLQLEQIKNTVKRDFIDASTGVSEVRTLLYKYNDNWYTIMLARIELSNFSESELRLLLQPTYASLKQKTDNLAKTIQSTETNLAQLRSQAKYDVSAFLVAILRSILSFIGLVWIIGLVIEWVWLGVDIAGNLRAIREHFEQTGARET